MNKHDHVVARFNGADLTFKIARANLPTFERLFGPAYDQLRSLGGGKWTIPGLKDILAFGLLSQEAIDRLARQAERATLGNIAARDLIAAMEGRMTARETILHSPTIEAAFAKNPPAEYVVLAQAMLAAALLGIDEADATFTDEPDGA